MIFRTREKNYPLGALNIYLHKQIPEDKKQKNKGASAFPFLFVKLVKILTCPSLYII
jgi:hypothetical protein